jgi:hypothetical protein
VSFTQPLPITTPARLIGFAVFSSLWSKMAFAQAGIYRGSSAIYIRMCIVYNLSFLKRRKTYIMATIAFARNDCFSAFELGEQINPTIIESHKVLSCLSATMYFWAISERITYITGLVEVSKEGKDKRRRKNSFE